MTAQNKVEAVLFASGRAMEEEYIKELTGLKPKEVSKALGDLHKAYEEHKSALFVWNEGTKWKINVREDYSDLIKNLAAETELARPVMATLALIAYRSPILQSDVIKSRGEGAYQHIAELVDKDFVSKEKFGRSYKLKVSEKFFNYFDVEGDSDIREAFKDVKPKEIKQLGKLEVVNAETDSEAEMERQRRHVQLEIYDIKQQRENDRGFLDEFENRLGKVSENLGATEAEFEEQKNKYQPKSEEQEEVINSEREEESPVEEESSQTTEDEVPKEQEETEPEEDEDKKIISAESAENLDPQELAREIDEEIDDLTDKGEHKNI